MKENEKREGPLVRTTYRCDGCRYLKEEYERVQSDSGFNCSCTHPEIGDRYIGWSNRDAPEWCPYRATDQCVYIDSGGVPYRAISTGESTTAGEVFRLEPLPT